MMVKPIVAIVWVDIINLKIVDRDLECIVVIGVMKTCSGTIDFGYAAHGSEAQTFANFV